MSFALGAMLKWLMTVTDVMEEVLSRIVNSGQVISLEKKLTICSFFANNAAPILCTGASPHRCKNSMKSSSLQQTRWTRVPRSRNHPFPPKSQRILSMLRHAKTPDRLSQSYSKLNGGQMCTEVIIRWWYWQWHLLYVSPPSSDRKPMALSGDTNPGLPFINSIIHEPEGVTKKKPILPLTALHRVGIVSMYSYSDTVNPVRQTDVRDSTPRLLTKGNVP